MAPKKRLEDEDEDESDDEYDEDVSSIPDLVMRESHFFHSVTTTTMMMMGTPSL